MILFTNYQTLIYVAGTNAPCLHEYAKKGIMDLVSHTLCAIIKTTLKLP